MDFDNVDSVKMNFENTIDDIIDLMDNYCDVKEVVINGGDYTFERVDRQPGYLTVKVGTTQSVIFPRNIKGDPMYGEQWTVGKVTYATYTYESLL